MRALLPDGVRRRFEPDGRYGLRVTLFAVALVLVAVPFGILTEQVVRSGPMLRVDQGVANDVHAWAVARGPHFATALKVLSWLGKPPLLTLLVALAAVFVYLRGRTRLAVFLVTTGTLGGLVDTAVKILVNRPRPEFETPLAHALGKSFPSGHAMSSTVVYGALLLAFLPAVPRRGRPATVVATVLLVLSIAASRLGLGVHFLSDVVGGLVLGLAWLAASVATFRVWRDERGKTPAPVLEGLEPEAAQDLTVATGP